MTHEQAINYLTSSGMTPEQVTEVVEALTEPHTETLTSGYVQEIRFEAPCADCVSRQAAIDKAVSWNKHFTNSERYISLTDIEALPSVTPVRKIGHWEYNQYGGNPNIGNWHCSECHRIIDYKPLYKWENGPNFKYCQNCGAKMEEVNT